MAIHGKGHTGRYTGNHPHHAKYDHAHTHVTPHNVKASMRDDAAHMDYLKKDILYDDKHGHSDIDMTADEKHISKLAGDLKYDKKHHEGIKQTSNAYENPAMIGPWGVKQSSAARAKTLYKKTGEWHADVDGDGIHDGAEKGEMYYGGNQVYDKSGDVANPDVKTPDMKDLSLHSPERLAEYEKRGWKLDDTVTKK